LREPYVVLLRVVPGQRYLVGVDPARTFAQLPNAYARRPDRRSRSRRRRGRVGLPCPARQGVIEGVRPRKVPSIRRAFRSPRYPGDICPGEYSRAVSRS
jgi:hypothetical protein